MSDTVSIRITADTSGVETGLQELRDDLGELKSSVQSAAASMSEGFAGMRGAVERSTQSMDALIVSMRDLRPQEIVSGLNEVTSALKQNSAALQEMAAKSSEGKSGFSKLIEGIEGAADVVGSVIEVVTEAVGFVVEAAKSFTEWGKAIAEDSEKIGDLATELGMSTRSVLELKAVATEAGVPFDKLSSATGELSRKFEQNPKLFKQFGIEVAKNADQMSVLGAVMDRFKETADGPDKIAAAMALMGRYGAEMVPFLNQGSDALAKMRDSAEALGAVNTDAIEKGERLAEATNQAKVAYDGLQQTLADALAPALTDLTHIFTGLVQQFIDSYNKGGLAKQILDDIGFALEGLGEIINGAASMFTELFTLMNTGSFDSGKSFQDMVIRCVTVAKDIEVAFVGLYVAFRASFDQIAMSIEEFKGNWTQIGDHVQMWLEIIEVDLRTFGLVVNEALSLQWGSIQATWDSGMAEVDNIVKTRGDQIANDAKSSRDKMLGYFNDMMSVKGSFDTWRAGMTVGGNGSGLEMKVAVPNWGDDDKKPDIGTVGKPSGGGGKRDVGGGSSKSDDRMQEWQEGLQAKRDAIQKEAEDEQSLREMSKAEEAEYWDSIRQMAGLTAAERKAVDEKYYAAAAAARKSAAADMMADSRRQIQDAQGNSAQQIAIARHVLAQAVMLYGVRSTQAGEAQRELTQLEEKGAEERLKIDEKYFKDLEKLDSEHLADEASKNQFLVNMGLMTEAQMYAAQLKSLQQMQVATDAAFNRRIAQLKMEGGNWQAMETAKAEFDKKTQGKITDTDRKAILARTQLERQAINQIAAGWAQGIAKMVTFQQGFTATIRSLWQTVQQAIGDIIAKILENWLSQEMMALARKIGLLKTETASTVEAESAKAGAGGTASMAAAPFPMNLSAAGFGTAMASTAAGFATMAAFDVGAYNLSSDGIGILHKGETVIPADQAGGWRNVMGLFASMPNFGVPSLGFASTANSNAPVAANDTGLSGGGFHYHDHSARGLTEAQIIANRNAFARAMKMAHREGKLGFSLPS